MLDDYTIQFTLEQPDAVFIDMAGIISIVPEHILGDVPPETFSENAFFFMSPIGTGPFKLTKHVENQYILFERNETYFRGRPHIEKINWEVGGGNCEVDINYDRADVLKSISLACTAGFSYKITYEGNCRR